MCGLAGILLGSHKRTRRELADIIRMFSRLLVHSEHRGPHATGAAIITATGKMLIEKAPEPAHRFVSMDAYHHLCTQISQQTTVLMGHTRWPTQGSHYFNHNNQPLLSSDTPMLAITHNGDIPRVNRYFSYFHLTREWDVDSELILRLACRHSGSGGIEIPAFMRDVALCAGHLAAVLVSAAQPEKVVFLRRDRPLHLAWHTTRRLLAYASEHTILLQALTKPEVWQFHSLEQNTAWIVSCDDLSTPTILTL